MLNDSEFEALATAPASQSLSSKNTSINSSRLPKAISYLLKGKDLKGYKVFDFGCGKFSNSESAIVEAGGDYIPYDPYNLPHATNIASMRRAYNEQIMYVVCSNVLNVIREDRALEETLERLVDLLIHQNNCELIVTIYEGNKTSIGAITRTDQYQRNEPISFYKEKFQKHGLTVDTKKGCLIIRNLV
ncbi:hypothetical protein [Vibrio sp. D431a]|uniref:hypothetical protein n=1 Tax=Vibrio sp. D431a TaxID=2837388 RepID=UPI002553515D|nr:hypothetical protein [Vibrio sp. D431a]MDK9790681.1 hypothetical protein [Vibrio sp. D431a]